MNIRCAAIFQQKLRQATEFQNGTIFRNLGCVPALPLSLHRLAKPRAAQVRSPKRRRAYPPRMEWRGRPSGAKQRQRPGSCAGVRLLRNCSPLPLPDREPRATGASPSARRAVNIWRGGKEETRAWPSGLSRKHRHPRTLRHGVERICEAWASIIGLGKTNASLVQHLVRRAQHPCKTRLNTTLRLSIVVEAIPRERHPCESSGAHLCIRASSCHTTLVLRKILP